MRACCRTVPVLLGPVPHLVQVLAWLGCQTGFPALPLLVVVGKPGSFAPLPDLGSPWAHTVVVVAVVVGCYFLELWLVS